MEQNNKKLLIAIGASVGVAILGFTLFKLFSSKSSQEVEDQSTKQLNEDIKKLGNVKLNSQGVIPFDQFLEIFQIIRKHAKAILESEISVIQIQRRELLRDQKNDEYRELVIKQTKLEEDIYFNVSNRVLAGVELEEGDFQKTQQLYMTQPQYQTRFFQALQADSGKQALANVNARKPTEFTRDQAIEMFKFGEKIKIESMIDLQKQSQKSLGLSDNDYTSEMIVQQTLMADKLFLEFGVEDAEFNKVVAQYNLYQDPEVQRMLQDNMQNMPPEVMQMMMMQMMQGGGQGGPDMQMFQ
eukprot:403349215